MAGRSVGEGIDYPLQYSWAFLVAQLVNNPPAIDGDLGLIPGLGRSPGEGNGYSSILAWRIPWTEVPGRLHVVHGVTKSQTELNDEHFHFHMLQRWAKRKRRKGRELCRNKNAKTEKERP